MGIFDYEESKNRLYYGRQVHGRKILALRRSTTFARTKGWLICLKTNPNAFPCLNVRSGAEALGQGSLSIQG